MRIMRSRYLAIVLLPLAAAVTLGAEKAPKPAAAPPAADQTLSFPAQVEQVVVDVVVTDKKGNAVRGLKPEDMTVLEDGVPQSVVSFEAIQLPDQPTAAAVPPPPRPRVSVNTLAGGAAGADVRDHLRRHAPHALAGEQGEGRGGELPGEGRARGRPRDARLDGGRDVVDGPHDEWPRGAARLA